MVVHEYVEELQHPLFLPPARAAKRRVMVDSTKSDLPRGEPLSPDLPLLVRIFEKGRKSLQKIEVRVNTTPHDVWNLKTGQMNRVSDRHTGDEKIRPTKKVDRRDDPSPPQTLTQKQGTHPPLPTSERGSFVL